MEWLFLFIIVAVAAYWYFLRPWFSKPLLHRGVPRDQFPRAVRSLMIHGGHGSRLVIRAEGSESLVKFAKSIDSPTERGVHFATPAGGWSPKRYAKIKAALSHARILFAERPIPTEPPGVYLCVDRVQDPEHGARLAALVFDAAGIAEDQKFTVHFEGGPDLAEVKRHVDQLRRRRS